MLSNRGRFPQGKYCNTIPDGSSTGYDSPQHNSDDPATPEDALSRDDARLWKSAIQEEYEAQMRNRTWTLTDLPAGRKAIRCKWVYKTELDAEGRPACHKARLVIKGYPQRKGVDYEETYAPVVRHSSLQYLFATDARLKWMRLQPSSKENSLRRYIWNNRLTSKTLRTGPRSTC
ncbi:hypothetical protein RP20_CCG022519 [Aedes albopictus]|nr:hypothetical protein RP20_CCG022519 [Aedes albopictus]